MTLNQTFSRPFFGKRVCKLKSNHIFVLDTVRKICKAPNSNARHKKLANTNYHYVLGFFDEMSVSFMTTSKIITLLSLDMFAYYQLHMSIQLVIQRL